MIVYRADKRRFLSDALSSDIEDRVAASLLAATGKRVGLAEQRAWRESLTSMAKVLNHEDIPDDSGVAIEYTIPQTAKRVDFILSGRNEDGEARIVIVELKQWSSVQATDKDAIVVTRLGGRQVEVSHPSYQAWSYAALLQGFNEAVHEGGIELRPCAYLHNYVPDRVIDDERYGPYLDKAPVFLKGDAERAKLRAFIRRHVRFGDDQDLLYRIENGRIRPSKRLVDSLVGMLQGKQEFVLVDDQKVAYENALAVALRASRERREVVLIEGGPGTGKSVLAINLLVELTRRGLVCKYVSKNAAPREVYKARLTGTFRQTEISNLFGGSGAFHASEPDAFDVLIVDEAHRLNEKSGLYGNLGDNQIREIMRSAACTIFFVDDDQVVTLRDIGTRKELERHAQQAGARTTGLALASQFRCSGSDGYLAWLDHTLGVRETANPMLDKDGFDFRVMDSPNALVEAIEEKNRVDNRARVVAGYCWNWISSKDPTRYDIEMPELYFRRRWNLRRDGSLWIVADDSVAEIGCIHTSQGLEVDFIGVIIGPDLVLEEGQVKTRPDKRARTDQSLKGLRKMMRTDPEAARAVADRIVRNTYRTLMTRGLKGCYVYCTDSPLAQHLRSRSGG